VYVGSTATVISHCRWAWLRRYCHRNRRRIAVAVRIFRHRHDSAIEMIEDLRSFSAGSPESLQFVTITPGFPELCRSPTEQGGFSSMAVNNPAQTFCGRIRSTGVRQLQMNYGVSVEAVQEFKVMTTPFDAQFGRTSGGLVNLVTKSGTNVLHGSSMTT